MMWLFNLSTMRVCGEGYSRNQTDIYVFIQKIHHFKIFEIKYIVVLSYYLKQNWFFFIQYILLWHYYIHIKIHNIQNNKTHIVYITVFSNRLMDYIYNILSAIKYPYNLLNKTLNKPIYKHIRTQKVWMKNGRSICYLFGKFYTINI